MSESFILDERLKKDTLKVASWPLSEVLLMNDVRYPWLILVPRVVGVTELHRLNESQQIQLLAESNKLSRVMEAIFDPFKLNIAAIGNVVRQLHIHHVARYEADFAWPAPVWGQGESELYSPVRSEEILTKLRLEFKDRA